MHIHTSTALQLYKGMLLCFFHGRSCFLVARSSRSSHILLRVSWGRMMSSINPESERATNLSSPHVSLSETEELVIRRVLGGNAIV